MHQLQELGYLLNHSLSLHKLLEELAVGVIIHPNCPTSEFPHRCMRGFGSSSENHHLCFVLQRLLLLEDGPNPYPNAATPSLQPIDGGGNQFGRGVGR